MKNIQNCSLNFVFNNQPFCLSLFFSLKHNNLSLNFCTQNHPQPNELTISKFLFAFLLPFFVCCTLHFQYQSNDLILSVTSSLNNSILIINPFGKKGSVKKRWSSIGRTWKMMAFSFVSAWNKRRRQKKSSQLEHQIANPCTFIIIILVMYHLQLSLSRFFSWLTKLCSSGIYRPVELWQLEDQTLQRPSKRHHGSAVFTLREMEDATCSFSDANLLGKGGFGRVYRGTLQSGEVRSSVFSSQFLLLKLSFDNV